LWIISHKDISFQKKDYKLEKLEIQVSESKNVREERTSNPENKWAR